MPLSPKETQVLALADQGKSYKEISAELDISVNTVKTYAQRIIVKTMATCLDNAAYLRRLETEKLNIIMTYNEKRD